MHWISNPDMPNLTTCKDCGHRVSERAKTCPSCGVSKPGAAPSRLGTLFKILLLLIVFGIVWPIIQDDPSRISRNTSSGSQTPAVPTYTPKPRSYTDAEIQEVISSSDDYETYRAAFTKAATELLTSRRCGRYEMTQYGGFVKAQGNYKNQPVYFTYCGGSTRANRIYLDASTGEIFK